MAGKNTARRDHLVQIQGEAQGRWSEGKVFEAEAPGADGNHRDDTKKFFGNFPYPYMNGLLHLGHAFSLSKLEFAAAYHRLLGENVLFPQGFHCTGMPIKACADKLNREIETYGCPPVFEEQESEAKKEAEAEEIALPGAKKKGKKSKAQAKQGRGNTQWDILLKSGIPEEEVPQFRDPVHWLNYFPPLAERDIKSMGCGVDWRRSFITTDVNPYYDSFVRWQFWKLKKLGKVVKDKRHAIYSPLDGQPCADHDRASGEGVGPQEYTLIKMKIIFDGCDPSKAKMNELKDLCAGRDVYMLAATLRPETMYGQTNAWILPEGVYGAYEASSPSSDVYIMCEHAARNMVYQEMLRSVEGQEGTPHCMMELTGMDLMGAALRSPLAAYEKIHVLPLLTVSLKKGTGIVTSVPSDSPDDFMGISDLKKKEKFREKFGVKDEHVLPFEVVPVLEIPQYGSCCAEKVCKELKIQSQNDKVKLEQAKKVTYLKGFTDGVMVAGKYAGQKVQDMKPLIRKDLIDSCEALGYFEPEKQVMSRSGDECVVALTDQWYLVYGEEEWLKKTEEALSQINTFKMPEVRNGFVHTLGWMKQWACSRSFGLGTLLPWDEEFLIESLSDSTIYMAYYTVAHILQNGDMYGKDMSSITPEQMTPEVWDYVFQDGPFPSASDIPENVLNKMKREFNYWYPFDLRVSGKDLIQNHLTFCLYNHTAIFPEDKWPRGMRCNGHLLLNNEKMSKSTGNFKTLREAIFEYSADAMRFALADAGDTIEDANFVHDTANAAILRLTKEIDWMEEVCVQSSPARSGPLSFADRVFESSMSLAASRAKAAYDDMLFREALKCGFYELQAARDEYRQACGADGMHTDLVRLFCEVQIKLITPICPHTCEHIWSSILKKEGFVVNSGWPQLKAADLVMYESGRYLQEQISSLRSAIQKAEAPPKKKAKNFVKAKVVALTLFVSPEYTGWRRTVLETLGAMHQANKSSFPDSAEFESTVIEAVKKDQSNQMSQKDLKMLVLPFAKYMKDKAVDIGPSCLNVRSVFDEIAILNENISYLKRALSLDKILVESTSGSDAPECASAYPGSPEVRMEKETPPQPDPTSAEQQKNSKPHKGGKNSAKQPKQKEAKEAAPAFGGGAATSGGSVSFSGDETSRSVIEALSKQFSAQTTLSESSDAELSDGNDKFSGLITSVRYLSNKFGSEKLRPKDLQAKLANDEMLDFCSSTLLPALRCYDSKPVDLVTALAMLEPLIQSRVAMEQRDPMVSDVVVTTLLNKSKALLSAAGRQPPLFFHGAQFLNAHGTFLS